MLLQILATDENVSKLVFWFIGALLGVLVFFLVKVLNKVDSIANDVTEIKIQQKENTVKIANIEKKSEELEERQSRLHEKIFNYVQH